MKILKSEFEIISIGLILKTRHLQLFFGNKNSSLDSIQNTFSALSLKRIKQTHSDIIVEASDTIVEADSHYTQETNAGLLISTADCLPVLIFCSQTNRIAAVHAGWKGVANQIVLKTAKQLISTGSSHKIFEFWIGPHILQDSFEIDLDVLKQLEASAYGLKQKQYYYEQNNKFYVDLNQIVFSQIAQIESQNVNVFTLDVDTKTDPLFWSFRRDKEKAGRNLSFIAKV